MKNFENRLTFGKVMVKNKNPPFNGTQCRSCLHAVQHMTKSELAWWRNGIAGVSPDAGLL